MNHKTTVIYGSPGCGKTENLMNIIEKALENGIKPWSICYLSYTKAAVKVAIQRAMERAHRSPILNMEGSVSSAADLISEVLRDATEPGDVGEPTKLRQPSTQ